MRLFFSTASEGRIRNWDSRRKIGTVLFWDFISAPGEVGVAGVAEALVIKSYLKDLKGVCPHKKVARLWTFSIRGRGGEGPFPKGLPLNSIP